MQGNYLMITRLLSHLNLKLKLIPRRNSKSSKIINNSLLKDWAKAISIVHTTLSNNLDLPIKLIISPKLDMENMIFKEKAKTKKNNEDKHLSNSGKQRSKRIIKKKQ